MTDNNLETGFEVESILAPTDPTLRPRKDTFMPAPTSQKKYWLEWVGHTIPSTMRPGVVLPVTVTVKNTGDWLWPDKRMASPEKLDGTYAVRLSYRWAKPDGQLLTENTERADLAASIEPGTVANFIIKITPPAQPANYQLELDLVEELVTFFSAKGMKKLVLPVTVG